MLSEKLVIELREYVKKHLNAIDFPVRKPAIYIEKSTCEEVLHTDLEDFIKNNRKPTFSQILFGFIDKKGASDSDIYKKAGIDRRHFSKIRSNPDYKIGKNSAIALALALELNKNEVDELLSASGYSLSENDTFDLVIMFCIKKKIYDMNNVNQALDYFSLKPLAGALE